MFCFVMLNLLISLLNHVGMLSKSKGQILRVAAAFHILFAIGTSDEYLSATTDEISEEAIIAAINFVNLCCQHTAFMAGRGTIAGEIELIKSSMFIVQ